MPSKQPATQHAILKRVSRAPAAVAVVVDAIVANAPRPQQPTRKARKRTPRQSTLTQRRAKKAAPTRTPSPPQCQSAVKRSRSAEHTSALQSLMRLSYADFCLKNKPTHHHP